ncbi:MAG: hypothetical protein MUP81_02435 [Dehalococcoidia bacterium]|nr:hypothetical protein [Dehalococcoidia bacterium]
MTTVLEIDTTKSLYKSSEILIDGTTFRIKTITLGVLEAIQLLQKDAEAGSVAAIRKMIESVLEGPTELLLKLTVPQVAEVIEAAVGKAVAPKGKEKNGRRPGLKK